MDVRYSLDFRQAAEERAKQAQQQYALIQKVKERYSERSESSADQTDPELAQLAFDPSALSVSQVSPYRDTNQRYSLQMRQKQLRQSQRLSEFVAAGDTPLKESLTEMLYENAHRENITPRIAKLAASEYKLNGIRARANSGEYVRPRWIPDEAMEYCLLCSTSFTVVNRRHHCRYCGNLVCDTCSGQQALLPIEFGLRDPQRVCNPCFERLKPLQSSLINHIANHERENEIQPIIDQDFPTCQIRRYSNLPFSFTLGSEIRKASYSIYNLFNLQYLQDKSIPLHLLAKAKGVAFLTVMKAGFFFAPKVGTGLVIARLPSPNELSSTGTEPTSSSSASVLDPLSPAYLSAIRWSAPSAIGTFGVSCGAVIGVDVTDYVIILNTAEAVEAFCTSGQVTIGAGFDIAVGPVGRNGSGDLHISSNGVASAYSYSHSRGVFAGVALDGAVILNRSGVNSNFYGRAVTPSDLLHGIVPPPRAAKPLYAALQEALLSIPKVEHSTPAPLMSKLANLTAANPVGTVPLSLHSESTKQIDQIDRDESNVIDLQNQTSTMSYGASTGHLSRRSISDYPKES